MLKPTRNNSTKQKSGAHSAVRPTRLTACRPSNSTYSPSLPRCAPGVALVCPKPTLPHRMGYAGRLEATESDAAWDGRALWLGFGAYLGLAH